MYYNCNEIIVDQVIEKNNDTEEEDITELN